MVEANISNIPSGSPNLEKYPDFPPLKSSYVIEPTDDGTRAYISWNHVTKDEKLLYEFKFKSVPEMPNGSMKRTFKYEGYRSSQYWEPGYEEHKDRKGTKKDRRPYVQLRGGYEYTVEVTCALLDSPNTIIRKADTIRLTGTQRASPAVQLVPSAVEPDQPIDIPVVLDISAFCTKMTWKSENKNIRYQCEGHCVTNDKIFHFEPTVAVDEYTAFVKTRPGYRYRVKIEGNVDGKLLERTLRDIKAVFSDKEQTEVFEKAMKYVENSTMSGLSQINRCHEKKYWDTISQDIMNPEATDIMKPLKKDNCGQPANRINSVLHGIFFYAREKVDGTLPTESVYGDIRLVVPIEKLLHPPLHNFFFADFYCMNNESGVHFVTIVVSKKRSFADSFCREYLKPIDIYSNPFIQAVSTPSGYKFKASQKVYVEICYTEDVRVSDGVTDLVTHTGKEDYVKGSAKNNRTCKDCNLKAIESAQAVEGILVKEGSGELSMDRTLVVPEPAGGTLLTKDVKKKKKSNKSAGNPTSPTVFESSNRFALFND